MGSVKEDKRGSILVTTLWIMAILTLLAMGIGFRVSLEVRLSKYNMDRLQARYLAKAGIEKARELLSKDVWEYDTFDECGVTLDVAEGETPETIFGPENNKMGEGYFSIYYDREKEDEEEPTTVRQYGMLDEERKININISATAPTSEDKFKKILKGLSDNITDEIVNAIIDWQGKGSGLTGLYYSTLEHPYKLKKADFEYVEELLLVKDVTPQIYNEIRDYVTVYSNGKINVNTASKEVLSAVVGGVTDENPDLVAARIVDRRKERGGWDKDGAFLEFLNSIISPSAVGNLSNYITVSSGNFRIISHGTVRKITKTITGVVDKKGALKYYYEE